MWTRLNLFFRVLLFLLCLCFIFRFCFPCYFFSHQCRYHVKCYLSIPLATLLHTSDINRRLLSLKKESCLRWVQFIFWCIRPQDFFVSSLDAGSPAWACNWHRKSCGAKHFQACWGCIVHFTVLSGGELYFSWAGRRADLSSSKIFIAFHRFSVTNSRVEETLAMNLLQIVSHCRI